MTIRSARRSRRFARSILLIVFVASALLVAACSSSNGAQPPDPQPTVTQPSAVNTPVSVPSWTPPIASTSLSGSAPTPQIVAYGSDAQQKLEIYQSSGDPMGTILYVHGGAWIGGSAADNTAAVVLNEEEQVKNAEFRQLSHLSASSTLERLKPQLVRGWDIVSIDYRLATNGPGPGIRATQLLNDVDRAVRYVMVNAKSLDLDLRTFIISGGSAGGHLALMEALSAKDRTFADPTLPAQLAAVDVAFDGVLAFVAPADMNTLYKAGGVAPGAEESLLGCSPQSTPVFSGFGSCSQETLDRFSPLYLTRKAASSGVHLPPAYFAYGGQDTLVLIATQGKPEVDAWAAAAGPDQTWYDFPPTGTHNIDDQVNELSLNYWLDNTYSRKWTGPGSHHPVAE